MFTYYIERGIEIILILDYGIKESGFNHLIDIFQSI